MTRFVGGPLDGTEHDITSHIVEIEGESGRYIRWWDIQPWSERDLWIYGVPKPPDPERYYLWQPEGEFHDHPAHVAIRQAIRDASDAYVSGSPLTRPDDASVDRA